MKELLVNPEFWQAVSNIAWPAFALVIVLIFRWPLNSLLRRDNLTIKVAGIELSVPAATEQVGKGLSDLQERLAAVEDVMGDAAPGAQPEIDEQIQGTILWVDDIPSNNAFLIERFESEGYRVRKELSTKEGLNALEADKIDFVISDLSRKEDGKENPYAGLEFINALRLKGLDVPVLIFAGPWAIKKKDRLLDAGANAVTTSGVDVMRFVRRRWRNLI